MMSFVLRVTFFVVVMWAATGPGFAQRVLIKMGTIAPEGSPWHQILQKMGQEWRSRGFYNLGKHS